MAVSKKQIERVLVVCNCGCGETFSAFPVYKSKKDGGGLRVPDYKRGHHPNCRKHQTNNKPAWNKGLTKDDHPSIAKMGYQIGHKPYNDWSHVNEMLKNDLSLRKKWLESKRSQVPWNKGKTKEEYQNGFTSGPEHGNWKGGDGGVRDTAEWQELRHNIRKRDNYTCQICGDSNYVGRGVSVRLEVHHIIAVCEDLSLALEPSNLITLCATCHRKTHNYGSKAVSNHGGK